MGILLRGGVVGLVALALVGVNSLVQEAPAHDTARSNDFCSKVISLDGDSWQLATDPQNIGKQEKWFSGPRSEARPTRVPWIIQDVFPDYHGVVWYWRDFDCPPNADAQGRFLLRFWSVDYLAEVWVNDQLVGRHECADGPFELDITDAVKPGGRNRLAMRVLNPHETPLDGITLAETPHRNKTSQFSFGSDYNHGGIEDSVELLVAPALRIVELHVQPNPATGQVRIDATINNASDAAVDAELAIDIAPARDGNTLAAVAVNQKLSPGISVVTADVQVTEPRRWNLDDPYLYRATAALRRGDEPYRDATSMRFGFRDFRVENGYFMLNGRRLFLRSSHTGNMAPIGIHLPWEREWFRQDILYTKTLGFNMIRFIAGLPARYQLDLCDELGMLVYEEPYAAWLLADSPQMSERYDRSLSEMIRRDRNRPSVVIWGLLNETHDGPVFRQAVTQLPAVRQLDESRVVLLNSGRFDCDLTIGSIANPAATAWQSLLGGEGEPPKKPLKTIYPSCENAGDAHIYPQVPHRADAIELLRNYGHGQKPFFLSEYGIASPVDLVRIVRQYEQRNKASCGEAQFYRAALDKFLADWQRWRMDEVFGRPEQFFAAAQARMAGQRLLGINALRANPQCNGYNLTGTVDQGYSGEGLTTPFRELKPGTSDALHEALAPLRLCAFVEPYHAYRGAAVQLQIVLANEDRLRPGDYPVRVDILNDQSAVVHSQPATVTISPPVDARPTPFAIPVVDSPVVAAWPAGRYRVHATFERDAAATGGTAEFFVSEPESISLPAREIVLLGDDAALRGWLSDHHARLSDELSGDQRRLIVIAGRLTGDAARSRYRNALAQVAGGSAAIFLTPETLAPEGLQLPGKGHAAGLPSGIYHKEEWNARHAVFTGMPSGGLMDYVYYRNLIPSLGWQRDGTPPAEILAGAIQPAPGSGYASGLLLFADHFGAGRYFINTLRVAENLGRDPAADRLLANLLVHAASELNAPPVAPPRDLKERLAELAP